MSSPSVYQGDHLPLILNLNLRFTVAPYLFAGMPSPTSVGSITSANRKRNADSCHLIFHIAALLQL
jgi:hypothetical protein